MRLPRWFQAPAEPIPVRPIRVDADTTPRRLAARVILGAPGYTAPAGALAVGHQIGEALVPVIMGFAIDQAVATGDPVRLALCLVLLAADFAMLSYSYRFGSRIGLLGMEAVQHRLRTLVAGRLLDPTGVAGRAGLPGTSLSIAATDVNVLSRAVFIAVFPVGQFAGILLCAVVLLAISWQIGLIVLIGVPLLLLLMDRAGGPLRRRSERQSELAAEASGKAADLLAGYRILSGLGAQAAGADRYRRASRDALDGSLHAAGAQGVFVGSMNLATGLFVAGLAVVAGLRALDGDLTVGQLITVVGITQYIIGPIGSFASAFGPMWAGALAAAARVLTVLTLAPRVENPGTASPEPGEGHLRLTGDDDLHIAPGECVGLRAGPAEAAELAAVLSGAAEPRSGTATWQGRPLGDFDLDALRASILVVPHHAALFDGTIRENVALGTASEERTAAALEAADCAEIVESAPDGLDAQVGDDGLRLSGGQRQRLALARALAQHPPLLVLHEPTTAVDSVTEARIAERLRAARGPYSTLLITDAPALLAVCDRVIGPDRAETSRSDEHAHE
ncbi:ABC transporter transmembrane domain-containing protein [Glycomyces harbinensis]|uniref:ABC-type multidrug transport system, ATPase and permease component n=1 Tax=Glycomyces harbinensis TaxID=58114 RepID=A0A1G7BFX5_9ACTN|nr:ABC transporter ATP-binding protein [Glycomyces harbinensis]SDE25989.1 ABC-type multidrug transport system, ATPase and permease component [Glycomyces harbinensis]